jgi:uncharacterized protein YkwD
MIHGSLAAVSGLLVGLYIMTVPYGSTTGWAITQTFVPRTAKPQAPAAPVVSTPQSPPAPAPKPPPPKKSNPPAQATQPSSEIASISQCPTQNDPAAALGALVCLTNHARTYHKLNKVSSNGQLNSAASSKINDMQNCGYSHTACGHPANYWIDYYGYSGNCTGENIAQGQNTPHDVFVDWMGSSGHRANILNGSYRDMGIATGQGSNGLMWVMELGGC